MPVRRIAHVEFDRSSDRVSYWETPGRAMLDAFTCAGFASVFTVGGILLKQNYELLSPTLARPWIVTTVYCFFFVAFSLLVGSVLILKSKPAKYELNWSTGMLSERSMEMFELDLSEPFEVVRLPPNENIQKFAVEAATQTVRILLPLLTFESEFDAKEAIGLLKPNSE